MQEDPRQFYGKSEESRKRQLKNLRQYQSKPYEGPIEPSLPFLKDPRNRDVRYFLETHYFIERRRTIELEDWQVRNFLDPVYPKDGSRPYQVAIFGTPKKNGKSTISAGLGIFELFFSKAISPEVYALATDVDQAKIIFNKSKKAILRNPHLKKLAKIREDFIETPFNDGIFRVLSSDVDSSEGKNPSCVLLDEASLSKWLLWASLLSGMIQRQGSGQEPIGIVTTTAGYDLSSEFYKLCQRCERSEEPETYYFWTHDNLASWIRPKDLENQRKRLSSELYQRYHQNLWIHGAGAFCTTSQVEACIDNSWGPQGAGSNHSYILSLDLGISRDRTAVAIVHKNQHRVILDSMKVWSGSQKDPVLISDIEDDIRRSCKYFNISKVIFDPWQSLHLSQRLKNAGIRVEKFNFSGDNIGRMTANLRSLIRNQNLMIYRDQGLIDELLSVQTVQKAYGERIDHKASGFSDRVIALGMAALEAAKEPDYGRRPQVKLIKDKTTHSIQDAFSRKKDAFALERGWHGEEPVGVGHRAQPDPDLLEDDEGGDGDD